MKSLEFLASVASFLAGFLLFMGNRSECSLAIAVYELTESPLVYRSWSTQGVCAR